MPNRITVMCVGPAGTVRGGISSLIEKIHGRFPNNIRFRIVATFSQYTGSDQPERKSRFVQGFVFIRAFFRILLAGILSRDTIFHVHLSMKGSTLRKGLVCVALRALRCPFIVHAHANEDSMFHGWVPQPLKRVLLWGMGGADYFIALTRFWGDFHLRAIPISADRLLLLPNPVVVPRFIPDRTRRQGLHFLFLGRIGERKGAFDIIHAFAAFPDEIRRRSRLTLAGDGDTDAARNLANHLGCLTETSVRGWVEQRETERMLADADAFLLPSRGEGMSMALLEAMAWGLAVVTSGSGGADEFLLSNYNCLLVKPGDVPEITGAMRALAGDTQLRLRLGKEARKTVARFSIDNYMTSLIRLYDELAKKRLASSHFQKEVVAFGDAVRELHKKDEAQVNEFGRIHG
jgi:glycosyltransferase involved in cell wall biosynthesis